MITRLSGLSPWRVACWRCRLGYCGSSGAPSRPAFWRTMDCISSSGILPYTGDAQRDGRVEHVVKRVQRQRVHHRIVGEGHLRGIQRTVLERAATGEEEDHESKHGCHGAQPSAHRLAIRAARGKQAEADPADDDEDDKGGRHRKLVALPEHAEYFFRAG